MTKSDKSLTPEDAAHQSVCARVKRLAMEQGMSNAVLQKRAGVSHMLVYKVMCGNARMRPATIGKFAAALGVDPDYLVTGEANRNPVALESVYPPSGQNGSGKGMEERLLALEGDVAELRAACAVIKDDLSEIKTIIMRVLAGGGCRSGQGGGTDHNETNVSRKAG